MLERHAAWSTFSPDAIVNDGTVVGISNVAAFSLPNVPFLWQEGAMIDLALMLGAWSPKGATRR